MRWGGSIGGTCEPTRFHNWLFQSHWRLKERGVYNQNNSPSFLETEVIEQLTTRNFKSWKSLDLKLAPVTGLFGTNSSGKSSVLQLLLMLKQTKETTDRSLALDFGGPQKSSYVNLGSFRDAVYGHDEESKLSWRIHWKAQEDVEIFDQTESPARLLFGGNKISVSASVGLRGGEPSTDQLRYEVDHQSFNLERKESRPSAFSLETKGRDSDFRFIRMQGRPWDLPGPVKSYTFPDKAKTYFQNSNFLGDLEFSYENLMDNIFYLGPLREYPKREYIWSGSSPLDVGQQGARVVDALLSAKAKGVMQNLKRGAKRKPFEEIIAYWLKRLSLIHSFSVDEIGSNSNLYRVRVKKTPVSTPVLITDVGFGVSQILPVLVLLHYVPEGSTVLLEQPEIHLHPAVQSGLADVIINAAKHRNVQVIVESHSEHFLRRLQLRVAEQDNDLTPDDISLYFCEMGKEHSKATPLEIDLYGSIRNWPKDFFGDEFGEIAARQDVAIKRKLAAE